MCALAIADPPISSGSPGDFLTPPAPAPGESADQYIDRLFGPQNVSSPNASVSARSFGLEERDSPALGQYRNYMGIHELTWDNDTSHASYNFSVDLSNACTGLKLNQSVGLYTFANGTTKPKATLLDIVTDVWSLAPTLSDRRRRWHNHTNTLAEVALAEGNTLLNSGLICENYTATQVLALATVGKTAKTFNPVRDELRHLLGKSPWAYWSAAIISIGASAGIGASLAGLVQLAFDGSATAENMVQTGTVIGFVVFIGAFLNWQYESGRVDRIVQRVNGRLGGESVLQNLFISRFREVFATVQQSQERAWQNGGTETGGTDRDLGGFSVAGTASGGVSMPATPGGRGSGTPFQCLSDVDAVIAVQALSKMTSDEMSLRLMESIQNVELERMMNGEAGSVAAGPSEPDPSRPESSNGSQGPGGLCHILESPTEVSFRTAKGTAEASAQDLVEMGNLRFNSAAGSSSSGSGSGDESGREGGSAASSDKGKEKVPNWDGSDGSTGT